jgi:hypothetical protein
MTIEFALDLVEILSAVGAQVPSLGEELAEEPIGVLVGAPLPPGVNLEHSSRSGLTALG